jgi:hypothetical protein
MRWKAPLTIVLILPLRGKRPDENPLVITRCFFIDHFDRFIEQWQITLDDIPDNLQVNPEIFMYQKVAKIFDVLPDNMRILLFYMVRHVGNRLTDEFKLKSSKVMSRV